MNRPIWFLLALLLPQLLGAEETSPLEQIEQSYETGSESERVFSLYRAAQLPERVGEALIHRALKDTHPAVRSRAVTEWLRLRGEKGLESFVTPLQEQSPRVRRSILTAARKFAGDASIPFLLDALADPSPSVRGTAVRELRLHSGGLRHGFDPEKDHATNTTARQGWRRWWEMNHDRPHWARWVDTSRDSVASNRIRAAKQLAHAPGHRAVPALLHLLGDSSTPVRIDAIRSLRTLTLHRTGYDPLAAPDDLKNSIAHWNSWWAIHADRTVRSWVEEALGADSARQRGRAAQTLGLSGDRGAVSHLLPLLKDSSSRVRQRAQKALVQLTGRDHGYDPDASLPERSEATERWRTWWLRSRNRSSREWSHDALTHGTARDRTRAIRRLADQGDLEEFPWIVRSLRDRAGGVREEARRALGVLAGNNFGYDPDATPANQDPAIDRALAWWRRSN